MASIAVCQLTDSLLIHSYRGQAPSHNWIVYIWRIEGPLLSMNLPMFARRLLRPLLDPYRRYRHAKLIHAVRVSIGLLATILLTTGINLPHGEWASVTMLIVIGGLQHHGNIGKKAVERAYGTLIGASVGLLLVVQQAYFGLPLLTYLLMSVVCGFFS